MTVDLTRVDLAALATPITHPVDHGVGNLEVVVPPSPPTSRCTSTTGSGDVDVFGSGSDPAPSPATEPSWSGDGKPEFVLTINAGIGNVEVSRG